MIFEKEKRPFLLLDDAFVQYDDRRLEAAWNICMCMRRTSSAAIYLS